MNCGWNMPKLSRRALAHRASQQTVAKGDVAKLGQTDAGLAAAAPLPETLSQHVEGN